MDQDRPPRSRRHILAAAMGGLTALAAQALGRPGPARAGTDGDIAIGFSNPVSSITELENSSAVDTDPIFWANHHGYGYALWGSSVNNYGVYGSGWPAGVYGTSPNSDGIKGETSAGAKSGVWGNNTGNGFGVAGSTNGPNAGVWGSNGASGIGVRAS